MGSLAAGSAAAMGTGAFTSVRADRSISAEVVSDNEAYLHLDASVSDYAEETGNTVEFQFNSDAGATGQGLNDNASTFINDVLKIENRGTQTVRLQVGDSDEGLTSMADGPLAIGYTDDSNAGQGADNVTAFASSPAPSWWAGSGNINDQDLDVGDDLYVHFGFYLNATTEGLGEDASTDPSDIPETIHFYAGSTSTSGSNFS